MNAITQVRTIIAKLGKYTTAPIEDMDLHNSLRVLSKMVDEAIGIIENAPDCDNCDERKGDPPDNSWRD